MYKLFSWGANHDSQCGVVGPQKISFSTQIDDNEYLKVAVGYNHCLAIDEHHHLYGWGKNSHYQVLNSNNRIISTPTLIDDTKSYIDISCGLNHSAAIDVSNNLYIWGDNIYNAIIPDRYNQTSYIKDPLLIAPNIIKVSCGLSFTLFIDSFSNLYFLGSIRFSQYGFPGRKSHISGKIGDLEMFLFRDPYFLAHNIEDIWASSNYFFCRDFNNEIFTFGYNHEGNLGLGSIGFSGQKRELTKIDYLPEKVTNIATKGMFSYIQDDNNDLYVTGNNFFGQLGFLDIDNYLTEFTINPHSKVSDISCGVSHGFVKINNRQYGLGTNRYKEITDNNQSSVSSFVDVGVYDQIVCGLNFSIGLRSNIIITGSLSVIFNITHIDAKWRRVGTLDWLTPHFIELDLPIDDYVVEFHPIHGYITPDNIVLTVTENATTVHYANYYEPTGDLQVLLVPNDIGGRWRRLGTTDWHSSATVEGYVVVGNHTVEFLDVVNFDTPANRNVNITQDVTTQITEYYDEHLGSVQVLIDPSISNGQWRLLGASTWRDSGYVQTNLSVDDYSIEFRERSGWEKPTNISISITKDIGLVITGVYTQLVGSLQVEIDPLESTGQWRRVGTPTWLDHNYIETNIPIGNYNIEFRTRAGWLTPSNQSIVINSNTLTNATGLYIQMFGSLQVSITPDDIGGQWRRVGTSIWFNHDDIESDIPIGDYTLEFRDIAEYTKPANKSITIINATLLTETGIYIHILLNTLYRLI